MLRTRTGVIAVLAAAALWAQLALIPLVVSHTHGAPPAPSAIGAALFALGVLVAAALFGHTRSTLAATLILAGFPWALGIFALVAGARPLARFDAPARWIAAATGVGFVAAALEWARATSPAILAPVSPAEPTGARAPAPPLRRVAFAALALVATSIGLIAPGLVTAQQAAARGERAVPDALARARDAVTAAGGLAIGLLLVLGLGGSLLRGRGARRRTARAVAYLVWGLAVAVLLRLIESRGRS